MSPENYDTILGIAPIVLCGTRAHDYAVSTPPAELYVRTLQRAAERGGIEALCKQLGISPNTLLRYLEGKQPIPEQVFLGAIDVLMAADALKSGPGSGSPRARGNR